MSKTKNYYWTEAENAMSKAIDTVKSSDDLEKGMILDNQVKKLKNSDCAWSLLGYDEFEDDLEDWITDYITEGVAHA